MVNRIVAINGGIDSGSTSQCFYCRFHEERHKAEADVMGFFKFFTVSVADIYYLLQVNFVKRSQHRCILSYLKQSLGDTSANAGHGHTFFWAVSHCQDRKSV